MADVIDRWRSEGDRARDDDGRGGRSDRDRGQLILVTGLAVAVTLVALVLLLNTVIYTQNLATRGSGVEDGEAVGFRQEVLQGVGDVIDAENREDYDSHDKIRANVSEGIDRYEALAFRYRGERGTVAEIRSDTASYSDGWLIRHTNESKDFRSANTLIIDGRMENWTLAWSVSDARAFEITVNDSSLATTDTPDEGFQIVTAANATGEEWRAYVYRNATTGEIAVAVKNETDDSPSEVCSASGSQATVDLTAGTINGTPCPGLEWANGVSSPYDIEFKNGDAAKGRYGVTINSSGPSGVTDPVLAELHLNDPDSSESPYYVYAVYAAEFEIHFETPSVAFHTTVRVAPGEPE